MSSERDVNENNRKCTEIAPYNVNREIKKKINDTIDLGVIDNLVLMSMMTLRGKKIASVEDVYKASIYIINCLDSPTCTATMHNKYIIFHELIAVMSGVMLESDQRVLHALLRIKKDEIGKSGDVEKVVVSPINHNRITPRTKIQGAIFMNELNHVKQIMELLRRLATARRGVCGNVVDNNSTIVHTFARSATDARGAKTANNTN